MSNNNLRKEFERRVAKPPAGIAWSEEESHYVQIRRLSERSFNRYKRDYKVFCEGVEAGQSQYSQGDDLERQMTKIIEERDHWEQMATDLADRVGEHFGFDVGEHTSANCPVQTALEAAWPPAPVAVPECDHNYGNHWMDGGLKVCDRCGEPEPPRSATPTDKDHQQAALFRAHNGGED